MAERRITRESAEALVAQIRRALAADQEQATVELEGSKLVLEKSDDGGFTIGVPGYPLKARLVVPGREPPAGYPEDLPFIPDEMVMVTDGEEGTSLVWWTPASPAELQEELHRRSVADGWELASDSSVAALGVRHRNYTRDGWERFVFGNQGMVSLIQKPPRGSQRQE
jgi:hypothetical protein